MDTISAGGVIQWLMECHQRGLDFDHEGLDLSWGNGEAVVELVKRIAFREGMGDLLAKGVKRAAEEMGQDSYKWAIEAKGLEQSRVETRSAYGYALAFAVNPRGPDHLMTECGAEFGGKSLAKLARLQKGTFDLLRVQLLRIRKRQWKDSAYVERTHRTDDEEFYVPTLRSIRGLEEHFTQALKYLYTFNCLRPHFGKPMPGKTPSERVQELYPGLTKHFYLFPPFVLDYISAQEPFIGGHDLLAYYWSS